MPEGTDQSGLRPFVLLDDPRRVARPDLPLDLAAFYTSHEGVGLDADIEYPVRMGRLDEVIRVGYGDLHTFGPEPFPGWEAFSGFRLGYSQFLDEIVYVESAPCCQRGTILTLGPDVAGPGGNVPEHLLPAGRLWNGEPTHEELGCSLVLAESFAAWLRHLEQMRWVEYGLAPGGFNELPVAERAELWRYYRSLNPRIRWAGLG